MLQENFASVHICIKVQLSPLLLITTPGQNYGISPFSGCSLKFFLFLYSAVNKLMTDKMQNIFSLIVEHSAS